TNPCFRTAELNINIASTVIVAVLEKPDKASSVVTCVQLFKITKMTGTKSAIKAIFIGSKNNKTIIPVTNKSITIITISINLTLLTLCINICLSVNCLCAKMDDNYLLCAGSQCMCVLC